MEMLVFGKFKLRSQDKAHTGIGDKSDILSLDLKGLGH